MEGASVSKIPHRALEKIPRQATRGVGDILLCTVIERTRGHALDQHGPAANHGL